MTGSSRVQFSVKAESLCFVVPEFSKGTLYEHNSSVIRDIELLQKRGGIVNIKRRGRDRENLINKGVLHVCYIYQIHFHIYFC